MCTDVCWNWLIAFECVLHLIKYSKGVFSNFGTGTIHQWHNGSQQDSAEPQVVLFTDVTYNSPSSSSSSLICWQSSAEALINNSYTDLFTAGGQQIASKQLWLGLLAQKRFHSVGTHVCEWVGVWVWVSGWVCVYGTKQWFVISV